MASETTMTWKWRRIWSCGQLARPARWCWEARHGIVKLTVEPCMAYKGRWNAEVCFGAVSVFLGLPETRLAAQHVCEQAVPRLLQDAAELLRREMKALGVEVPDGDE